MRPALVRESAKTLERQKAPIERQIETRLERTIDSENTNVSQAHDAKIAKLKR